MDCPVNVIQSEPYGQSSGLFRLICPGIGGLSNQGTKSRMVAAKHQAGIRHSSATSVTHHILEKGFNHL
ncbi:MAG: hypothetical protein AB7T22_09140 [Calditrichaceae bacterium]